VPCDWKGVGPLIAESSISPTNDKKRFIQVAIPLPKAKLPRSVNFHVRESNGTYSGVELGMHMMRCPFPNMSFCVEQIANGDHDETKDVELDGERLVWAWNMYNEDPRYGFV
jgi:hypothetical protein